MLNHIVLMGRLTRDPELRRTGSGIAVASFTLAVDRDFAAQGAERETDFVDIVAWRNMAEFVSKYFTKGRMLSSRADCRSATGPTRKATSAARQRSWRTMSTSAIPSVTAPPPAASISPPRAILPRRSEALPTPRPRLSRFRRLLRPTLRCSKTTTISSRSDNTRFSTRL